MHETLCDYVLELVHNAIEADAKKVDILLEEHPDNTLLRVADDGRGMRTDMARECLDPFQTDSGKHPERQTGLGLALLDAVIADTGGTIAIKSELGFGTEITIAFDPRHPDSLPAGDLAELGLLMSARTEACSFHLVHRSKRTSYQYDFQSGLPLHKNPLQIKTEIARWEETLEI
ncbi:MAG: ATP-binding protein [Kiritimatiellia bacterium]